MKAAKLLTLNLFLLTSSLCLGQFADPTGSKSSQMHATLDWSLFGLKTEPERSFADSWARWKRKPSHPLAARIVATATYPELEQVALHLEKDQKTPFDYRMYLLFRVSGRVFDDLPQFLRPQPHPALNRIVTLSTDMALVEPPPIVQAGWNSKDPVVQVCALMFLPLRSVQKRLQLVDDVRRKYGAQTALWQASMHLQAGCQQFNTDQHRREAGIRAKAILDEAPSYLQNSPRWPVPRVLSEHFRGEAANARLLAERYLKSTLSESTRKRLSDYVRTGDPWHLHKPGYVHKMMPPSTPPGPGVRQPGAG